MCFRSLWCWRTMIPGKIFTRFTKFQGIVSVNGFGLPIRLPELLLAPLFFLRSFCFARIRLDPLGSQILHHDCISVIVSRFAIVTEDLVICCYQITKNSARITTLPIRLLHGALVIVALWQISQFRSFGKWLSTLCLPTSALLANVEKKKMIHEKNSRVNLSTIPVSVLNRGLHFLIGFGISVGLKYWKIFSVVL